VPGEIAVAVAPAAAVVASVRFRPIADIGSYLEYAVMTQIISDLADYDVAAWVMEECNWRFVFDSSDKEDTVQHELTGVTGWRLSELHNGIGVMEITVEPSIDGALTYTINTVCNETIEVKCADVRERHIKRRR
jgi:hypothetical protein